MTDRDPDLEALLGDDAFGRTTRAQEDHLRGPQVRFKARSTLRLMIASLEDQLANRAGPAPWRQSTERLLSRLRVSLVEFDGLCDEQESVYRQAIAKHKDAVEAELGDGYRDQRDLELWSVLEP